MSLEKCNTKIQRYKDTKSEDEISHEIIGASIEVHLRVFVFNLL